MRTYNNYLQKIREFPKLSAEEEKQLISQAKKGDKKAKEKFICSNLQLVPFVAKKYYFSPAIDKMDVIQEGNTALLEAFETYDPDKSKFSTFAVNLIKHKLSKFIYKNKLTNTILLDNIYYSSFACKKDFENIAINQIYIAKIKKVFKFLSSKEKVILKLTYGLGQMTYKSCAEIGREYNLSRERIRQIKDQAILHLKKLLFNKM